jgi:serine/threonine-protein kinase
MIELNQLINGKYRPVRVLGDGGMGTVYEARHEGLGTRVAIKVLHGNLTRRSGLVERFLREARVSAQIRSPNVVQVMDVDRTEQGDAYIVMELLEGEPLSGLLEREGRVPIPTACDYTIQILEALEAAHALGVTHRDLKPENVFLTFVAGKPILKLIDFGIAKAQISEPNTRSLTVAGMLMGTAEYMAPEQAYSADKADARSDIYAVGVMLYEMIAGKRPVQGEDGRVIALKIERGEVQPLVHAAPETPRELAGLVHRAMAARPELRFPSATDMRLALETASGRRSGAAAAPAPVGLPKTGTLKATPNFGAAVVQAAQAAQVAPPGVDPGTPQTQRAPPVYGMPTPATPATPGGVASVAVGATTGGAQVSAGGARILEAPKRPPRRGRSSTTWLLVAVPILLGAGVVVMLAINAENNATPDPTPTATAHPKPPPTATLGTTTPTAPTAPPTPPGPDTIATLTPTVRPPPQPQHPHPLPSGSAAASAAAASASAAGAKVPPGFPTAFPSTIPNPFPQGSGVGPMPVFTIPTTFPFPIPGVPTAKPAPTATAPPAPTEAPPAQTGAPGF